MSGYFHFYPLYTRRFLQEADVYKRQGIASLSYDEKSQELINTRNEGAMLSDPSIAQGYMVKNMSEGVKNAGSNSGGAVSYTHLDVYKRQTLECSRMPSHLRLPLW